jgi:hypothetical protein
MLNKHICQFSRSHLLSSLILFAAAISPTGWSLSQEQLKTANIQFDDIDDIKASIIESRAGVKAMWVKFEVTRNADAALLKSPVLESIGKDEQTTFGFLGHRRYCETYITTFARQLSASATLDVWDGERMYGRENKILTISAEKSSRCDSCIYTSAMLWPIADYETRSIQDQHISANWFFPYCISQGGSIVNASNYEVAFQDGVFGNLYTFSRSAQWQLTKISRTSEFGKHFGLRGGFTEYGDFRRVGNLEFPFYIEDTLEMLDNEGNYAGVLKCTIRVAELKINEEVEDSLFVASPLPGETVHDRIKGIMWRHQSDATSIETVLANIEESTTFNSQNLLTLRNLLIAVIGTLMGVVVCLLLEKLRYVKNNTKST